MEAAQAPGSAHAGTAAAAAKALELMGEQNKVLNEENGALKEEIQLVKESLKEHLTMVQAILGEGVGAEEDEGDVRLLRHHEHEALKLLQGVMLKAVLDKLLKRSLSWCCPRGRRPRTWIRARSRTTSSRQTGPRRRSTSALQPPRPSIRALPR